MKIIGIGRNYAAHAKELNNEVPKEPLIFFMPDTALLRNNDDFYYPKYSQHIDFEIEVVVRICAVGKKIAEKFANKYYDAVALGIDFTARDLQREAAEKGRPWTIAKGFDHSAPISKFIPVSDIEDINNLSFSLDINGEQRQVGNTGMMIKKIDQLIAYISQYITIKKGDLIYTGTPAGVGSINIGDKMEGYLQGEKMLAFQIK